MKIAIVGAGPVGLYSSLRLNEELSNKKIEFNIDVFEKSTWPIDKACGQGIMPSGVRLLKDIGVEIESSYLINGVSYIDKSLKVDGVINEKIWGVERKILSSSLIKRVKEQSRIHLYPNTEIKEIAPLQEEYDYIFLSNGLNSHLRDQLGLTMTKTKRLRVGARVHFNQRPWSQKVEVYWGEGVEAYVTPVSKDRLEVAFLWYQYQLGRGADLENRLFKLFPELKNQLDFSTKDQDFKGYGPFNKRSSRIHYQNIYVIGDAYYFSDGITGEGISLGLKSADLIIKNFTNFQLINQVQIKLLYFNYALWVNTALFLSRHTKVRKRIFGVLSVVPSFFNLILKLNDITLLISKKRKKR